MEKIWSPTAPGKLFTKTPEWSLRLSGEQCELSVHGRQVFSGNATLLDKRRIVPGTFWATVTVTEPGGNIWVLDGIPNEEAKALDESIVGAIAAVRERERVASLLNEFDKFAQQILHWSSLARQECNAELKAHGWLGHEFSQRISLAKPQAIAGLLESAEVKQRIAAQPAAFQEAYKAWKLPFEEIASGINERHLAKVAESQAEFFAKVEKSPLTPEQIRAVVCLDNRVLLIASAGSGKTSTMVAKAGYALKNGYFAPEKMLLLAFNGAAAGELGERVKARLQPLGLSADEVVSKTFHAFGLEVIGAATGRRPSVAPWLDSRKEDEALLEMVDELKDKDHHFRAKWDMFRLVFGQDLPAFGKEQEAPDAWDRDRDREGFCTLNNEIVKSRGEQFIADWLFYNGVRYQYESPYEHDTADATHRQYLPDFYLPDAKAYLEHWGLNQNGEPPPQFKDYKASMAWKRRLHAKYGTTLLETTTADLWSGKAFHYLAQQLPKLGIALDPNPDREVPGRKPIEARRLIRTFRAFLAHAKSNQLTNQLLRQRLEASAQGAFRYRHAMFLDLFEKVWQAWEQKLQAAKCIDFEDMLNQAAQHIEQGRWKSPYELVMVDEFQDASQARARLVRALVNGPGKFLFAVGDDWQGINRYAGADLAVMTNFEARFGYGTTLKLEKTFRCPQSLCNISSAFVAKNPMQLRKRVVSEQAQVAAPVLVVRSLDEKGIHSAVAKRVGEIAASHGGTGRKPRVFVLGRYGKDVQYMPQTYDARRVDVAFITVHSSKGLEADHVIVPRMTSETLGFPSGMADDPVLQLAMPDAEPYEHAEERRLFYVALTRARSTATLITLAHKESPFIIELAKDHGLAISNVDGSESPSNVCLECGRGFMVAKTGKRGPFLSCSRFPRCKHSKDLPRESANNRSLHPRLRH